MQASRASIVAAKGNLDTSEVAGLQRFMARYIKNNQRVIATAMSGGRPGDRIDILLNVRSTY